MEYTDIVVGVDGSESSRSALRWAAAEARLRAARLKILTTYSATWPPEAFGGVAELPESVAQRYEAAVSEAVAVTRVLEPGVDVTGEAVPGEPVSVLLRAGHTAALVVVGNRGHGGLASLLLGSVSERVATRATGPVVVVRGRPLAPAGPIVVGVDGSPSAQHALELGFEEARRRGCGLVAVRGYPLPIPPYAVDVAMPLYDEDAVRQAEAHDLEATLAPWLEKYPAVAVKAHMMPGNPAQNLIDMSSEAGLLIVGSRGHGAFVGTILGSVGLQLLHHAACPVMIVHSGQIE
jgi:nucleotide-binding universal stress UspA family protein